MNEEKKLPKDEEQGIDEKRRLALKKLAKLSATGSVAASVTLLSAQRVTAQSDPGDIPI